LSINAIAKHPENKLARVKILGKCFITSSKVLCKTWISKNINSILKIKMG
jgi:hypothetical protein